MYRFFRLVEELNMYEKSLNINKDSFALDKRDELLSLLSKSKKYNQVYNYVKSNNLQLNHLIVPYIVYKDNNSLITYNVKEKKQFKEDYKKALEMLLQYKKEKIIDNKNYEFLNQNIKDMYLSFCDEFRKTHLDLLDVDEKVIYNLKKGEINKILSSYIDDIGMETYRKRIKFYNENNDEKRYELIEKLHEYFKTIMKINNAKLIIDESNIINSDSYNINVEDISNYSYEVVVLEIIYKLKCVELFKSKKNIDVVGALLEDLKFIKSNQVVIDNIYNKKKKVK